jgi:hypothetical protein
MVLIVLIDLAVIAALFVANRRGIENTLPVFAFVAVLVPTISKIPLPVGFDLTTHRLALMLLVVLFLLQRPTSDNIQVSGPPLTLLIGFHVVWCLLSTANSVVPGVSIKKLLAIVVEYYVLYWIFVRSITTVDTIHRILYGIVSAMILSSVFGAVEAYSNWSVLEWFPVITYRFGELPFDSRAELIGRGWRVMSTFPHAILYGAALAIAIPLTLYLISQAKTQRRRIFLGMGLLLMFLVIYKTLSRGPWIALGLSLVIVGSLSSRPLRKYLLILSAFTLLVLVSRPGVIETFKNIFISTMREETQLGLSYEYRSALLEVARNALSQDSGRMLWGYGLGSFYYLGLEGILGGRPYKFLSCDSAWIELLVETGYVGLMIVGLLLIKPAILAWHDFRRLQKPENQLSLILLVNMVAFYFMMTNVALYVWGQNGHMLWILIACSVAYGAAQRSKMSGSSLSLSAAPVALKKHHH